MRRAGILLHPTSLPGSGPAGDLGSSAVEFLDWLVEAGCSVWQVLPLTPPGEHLSPYDSPSAFAGATELLSLERLVEDGLLARAEVEPPRSESNRVSQRLLARWHAPLVHLAARRAVLEAPGPIAAFRERNPWVEDFALYRTLCSAKGVRRWWELPPPLRDRQPDALARAREAHAAQIDGVVAAQWLFDRQWADLRAQAQQRGIRLVGDVPIFVAAGGVDAWVHRELFRWGADAHGRPRPDPVTGVPPDLFSDEGQIWGNAHYAWEVHRATGFAWWVRRFRRALELADEVRIDHFRGFCAAWEIPAGHRAPDGRWGPAPGRDLFAAVRDELGALPVVAEDLGVITPEVDALRDDLELPGMKVLQFAFDGGPDNRYRPHNWEGRRWFAYTGTHDLDTTVGWYRSLPVQVRRTFRLLTGSTGRHPAHDLVRYTWDSPADTAIAPLQDILELGSEARMNRPGRRRGNWRWRAHVLPDRATTRWLAELGRATGRTS